MSIVKSFKSLTVFERCLWGVSVIVVFICSTLSQSSNILTIIASLVGVTALIFVAKGNVFGQVLTVCFSILYGIISWEFRYFGEVLTYLGMTAPLAVASVVSWAKNPYKKGVAEVKVNKIKAKEIVFSFILAAITTYGFYFVLKYFNTTNLALSTVSITTSFLAAYFTFRRSALYALAYAANDVVLILLWILATLSDISYLPMVICFFMFLINDIYGFLNWSKIQKRQVSEC